LVRDSEDLINRYGIIVVLTIIPYFLFIMTLRLNN
jgi:hypothetical protein